MGTYNVHGGHNRIVPGAGHYLDEVTEDRRITAGVIALLQASGHTAYNCTDDVGKTVGANLANIVAKCNTHSADLDISIHQNAAKVDSGDGKTKGVEVFVYSTSSKAYAAAGRVCAKLAALGFTNRGVKISTGLYVLRHTKSPAMLIEVGFVDDKDDADLYNKVGVNAICKAITEGILKSSVASTPAQTPTPAPKPASKPAAKPATSNPYRNGSTYTLKADALRVRTGAGTGYRTKAYNELSANAKKNAYGNGNLKKGTRVTCMSTKMIGNDIWMRIPSGWIAVRYSGKTYVG